MKKFSDSFLSFLFFPYRLLSVFIIQTSYVPDEYWQSLEVAHRMVFGYGYLTWEWNQGIRSYIYPSIIALLYKCLAVLNLDSPLLIIYTPKVLQAIFTAISDVYFMKLCLQLGFKSYWIAFTLYSNWFWFYCGSRTIVNTFETGVTTIALYYYPWLLFKDQAKGNKKPLDVWWNEIRKTSIKYLTLAAINCLVRPTAFIMWGPLILIQMYFMSQKYVIQFILNCIFPVVLSILPISIVIDSIFHGKFIFPAYNFLVFNVFKGISSFYGTHPFYWYFTRGLPIVLGLHFIPFILGFGSFIFKLFQNKDKYSNNIFCVLAFVLVLNILILSTIPHKEFRFILPLSPLMMLFVVKSTNEFFATSGKVCKMIWIFLSVSAFIIFCVLFGVIHQRGTIRLMEYLREFIPYCGSKCSYLFLMPCHTTPLYSHLHDNISTRFLTCEPPITQNPYDESEDFFNSPKAWIQSNWDNLNSPTHIAFFDNIENKISAFLKNKGFALEKRFFHTIFSEGNMGRYILVYEKGKNYRTL